jgi:hypothetical protein
MEAKTMTLDRAKMNVEFPEFSQILIYESWLCFTDIDYEALEYLVYNSSRILLPNVKALTEDKRLLLKSYKGFIDIGVVL